MAGNASSGRNCFAAALFARILCKAGKEIKNTHTHTYIYTEATHNPSRKADFPLDNEVNYNFLQLNLQLQKLYDKFYELSRNIN